VPAECPKCGSAVKEGASACVKCGLAVERFETFAARRDEAVPEALRTAWNKLRETDAWDDDARHDAVLVLATERGELGWLAGRYREAAKAREGDPRPGVMLDKIKRATEAMLTATVPRTKKEPMPYRSSIVVLGFLVVMIVIGAAYAFLKSRMG
jgi:hypothetical protein